MTTAKHTIETVLESVASTAVTPSGGAVAGLAGAFGAALGEMVCLHTVGKDGYEDVEDELLTIGDSLETSRYRLLELADEDVAAVGRVQSSFRESHASEGEQQEAMKRATEVPLETAAECLDTLEGILVAVERGNQRAVADGVVGAYLAHAGLCGAIATVRANLEAIDDEEFVAETSTRTDELEKSGRSFRDRI